MKGFGGTVDSLPALTSAETILINNSAGGRRSDKSPVDTARQLVTSLSELEKETAHSVWNNKSADVKSKRSDRDLSPSPLEQYLKHYDTEAPACYEPPVPSSAAKRRAKKHQAHLNQLLDAREVLNRLQTTRETLEGNLDSVLRSRRDVSVFSAMMASAPEGSKEQLRIQKMVNKKISALEADVQREVLRGLAQEQAQQLAAKREQERQRLAAKQGAFTSGGTSSTLAFQNTDFLAKNKFSISARQNEQSARLAYGKQNFNVNANTGRGAANTRGKENRVSKVKPPPKPTVIRDQKTLARTYGKPEYQRGRTTIRDPYMHFQNTKKGVASKTSVLNESAVSREGRSRSPPKSGRGLGETGNMTARQFYFSPTRGYIPLDPGDSAPIQGQLVSMAIPLGQPRMERGVRSAAVPVALSPDRRASNPVTSTPVPVTSTGNVAVVSFPIAEEVIESREREPELSKQVLPPIDIDSISPMSSRQSDIQIRSPQHSNVNLTFLQNTHDEVQSDENSDQDETLTEGDPELEQSGQGLQFPGYEPRSQAEYSGPSFPPQKTGHTGGAGDWMAGSTQALPPQSQLSDVMAEDLKRRDLLERNAVYWLEQELMAQVLSKVMPIEVGQKPEAENSKDIAASEADGSEISPREDSLLVADMIGQGGLQLFIDAGQPVDNALVQALVKEVLQEKVSSMLAARSTEGQNQGQEARVKDEVETVLKEGRVPSGPARVPTPETTPKTSPIASPRRQQTASTISRPVTPPLSPPEKGFRFKPAPVEEHPSEPLAQPPPLPPPRAQPEPKVDAPPPPQQHQQQLQQVQQQLVADTGDLDSEPSVSIDISEELRRVAGQGKPQEPHEPVTIRHSVATPPLSPPPIVEEDTAPVKRNVTPPPTPSVSLESSPAKRAVPAPNREPQREMQEEETEEEEDEEEEQPQPIMISVAVGEDHPLSSGVQTTPRRTTSPKRPRTPVSVATEPSPPPSTESSLSETVNENVSEGQWLLSRSEGQVVAGLHINEAVRKQILKKSVMNGGVDVSTASTLRDTDDLDLDDADQNNKSEGEFLYAGLPSPDQNPMLQLLAEMQRHPSMVPQRDIPGPQVRQILSGPAPQDMMSTTGRSLGELSMGQVPPTRLVQVQSRADHQQRQFDPDPKHQRGGSGQGRSLSRSPNRRSREGSRERQERDRRRGGDGRRERDSRTPSPLQRAEDVEEERTQGRGSPLRGQTPPPQQQLLSSGSTRGRSSRGQMQYQPVLSEGAPLATRGRHSGGYRGGARRSSDSKMSHSSDRALQRSGSSYVSESVSRSADSASLRRSGENNAGVLTSSFKSRQSSIGAKKSVDFDLTGTNEHRQWQEERDMGLTGGSGRSRGSSGGSSRDRYSPTRLSASSDPNRSRSLGLTYSFDGSMDDSELKRIVGSTGGTGTAPYRMSVTIPSIAGDEDSELSEIDISDRHYH
ncbi:talpid3 protein [Plakobranchus ocellatus]|uniref:Talpid3 protein n=1 Tax=Plakobranchus ocellatus TaxID=259542 RepID=A0AAV4AZE0_9GAST|nr:talpid3 protein [Plakobranchus ocellatus]